MPPRLQPQCSLRKVKAQHESHVMVRVSPAADEAFQASLSRYYIGLGQLKTNLESRNERRRSSGRIQEHKVCCCDSQSATESSGLWATTILTPYVLRHFTLSKIYREIPVNIFFPRIIFHIFCSNTHETRLNLRAPLVSPAIAITPPKITGPSSPPWPLAPITRTILLLIPEDTSLFTPTPLPPLVSLPQT